MGEKSAGATRGRVVAAAIGWLRRGLARLGNRARYIQTYVVYKE